MDKVRFGKFLNNIPVIGTVRSINSALKGPPPSWKYFSRADFNKAAGVLLGSMLLAACTPPSAESGEPIYGVAEVESERILSGSGGEYKIQKIRVDSLRPIAGYDDQVERALDDIESVIKLQKRTPDGGWKDVLIPGSLVTKPIINEFNSLLGENPDPKEKADFNAILFDPSIPANQKWSNLTSYARVPMTNEDVERKLDWLYSMEGLLGDIPDNAPWDLIFDARSAADPEVLADYGSILHAARYTGTQMGIFVPKDKETKNTKEEFSQMFLPVPNPETDRPRMYVSTFVLQKPPEKEGGEPTIIRSKRLHVLYGQDDKRNKTFDSVGGDLEKPENLVPSVLPTDILAKTGDLGSVVETHEINRDMIDFAFVPRGRSDYKGDIKPAIFIDDPNDVYKSKVYLPEDNKAIDRIDSGNGSWITKVTHTVNMLRQLGVDSAFKYGMLPSKMAFERIFKGGKLDEASGQMQLPSLALFPEDQSLVNVLATLYMQGNTLNQWGTVLYQGESENNPTVPVINFEGEENALNMFENMAWGGPAGAVEAGGFFNLLEIMKMGQENVVAYYSNKEGNALSKDVRGIGGRLEDLMDRVMVMGSKDELAETMKTLGKIAPWALSVIALFTPAGKATQGVWKVLTWIASKLI